MRWHADALDAPHSRREMDAIPQTPRPAPAYCVTCGRIEGGPHALHCAEDDGELVRGK